MNIVLRIQSILVRSQTNELQCRMIRKKGRMKFKMIIDQSYQFYHIENCLALSAYERRMFMIAIDLVF